MNKSSYVVEQYDGGWAIGLKMDDGEFIPQSDSFDTKEEAEAEIPTFEQQQEEYFKAYHEEKEAEEREENKQFPNVGYVRARIKKLADSGKPENLLKAWDASDKLDQLLNMDLHEHISWPLPSWKVIRSGRVYG